MGCCCCLEEKPDEQGQPLRGRNVDETIAIGRKGSITVVALSHLDETGRGCPNQKDTAGRESIGSDSSTSLTLDGGEHEKNVSQISDTRQKDNSVNADSKDDGLKKTRNHESMKKCDSRTTITPMGDLGTRMVCAMPIGAMDQKYRDPSVVPSAIDKDTKGGAPLMLDYLASAITVAPKLNTQHNDEAFAEAAQIVREKMQNGGLVDESGNSYAFTSQAGRQQSKLNPINSSDSNVFRKENLQTKKSSLEFDDEDLL